MDPGIRALLHLQPAFDFTKLDIISDRRHLACLLELVVRKGAKYEPTWEGDDKTSAFRFGAQIIGDTIIFFGTDEAKSIEDVTRFRGFAVDFRKQYSGYPDALKDTKAHYRMVSSGLGDLRILLRHAADGYVSDDTTALNDALANMTSAGAEQEEYNNITVMSGGTLIPRSALLELNTCSKIRDQTERLATKTREAWLYQSAHFVIAKHTVTLQSMKAARRGHFTDLRGTFRPDDIDFCNATDGLSNWTAENQDVIEEFHDLLLDLVERIRSAAAAGQGSAFLVEYEGEGMDIGIPPSETIHAISDELCARVRGVHSVVV